MHSGCTAVTALLRIEDADGKQAFLSNSDESIASNISTPMQVDGGEGSDSESPPEEKDPKKPKKQKRNKFKNALKSISGSLSSSESNPSVNSPPTSTAITPSAPNLRRVLYCANAGDARGVLCRGGKAVRLTYDHKGSDKQEAKRIMDAGGFVMSGRVNGVLAVTRSLGDSSMKEFVVGSPYTTETELYEEDEFVILACDGVRLYPFMLNFTLLIRMQLWDIAEDNEAVDHVRYMKNPQEASEELVGYAKQRYSNDNVTVVVVRFRDPPPR